MRYDIWSPSISVCVRWYQCLLWVALCLVLMPTIADAQVCTPTKSISKIQAAVKYLRRLSFDLRGRAPSYAELDAVVKRGYVDDATIDAMLNSSQFVTEMREYHKDLLTLNITDLNLGRTSRYLYYRRYDAKGLRPASSSVPQHVIIDWGQKAAQLIRRGAIIGCLKEKAKYDSRGRLLCRISTKDKQGKLTDTGKYINCAQAYYDRAAHPSKANVVTQEGFVEVSPYWDPDPTKKVPVCAMPAQASATGIYSYIHKDGKERNTQYNCDAGRSLQVDLKFHNIACGCGPRLKWCFRGVTTALGKHQYETMSNEVLKSYMEQTLRLIDAVIKGNRPYTDILTAKDAEYNGPISHFLTQNAASTRFATPSLKELPQIKPIPYYEFNTWRSYTRGTRESGLLTLPFYLLKYASNRGRLHRFYNAFLCQHFVPPAGGLPDPTDKCHNEPDLMQRCGCKHCHTTIEPGAAHWGRWQETAWFPILETTFKDVDPLCQGSKANSYYRCKTLYLTNPKHDKEKPFKGHLLAHVFATKEIKANITKGPAALVDKHIKNGNIPQCSVKNMYRWFVGQDLQTSQKTLTNNLVQLFQNTSYDTKKLVRAIVTSEEYRRSFPSQAP